ncbi:hypothetical protein TVAG_354610 [Trichomonas vaginalis G3]|uniref:F5/8 type C domain-containing protein n=1 Tax=Trichomonas vaginalis (strain ATCC PRA-98 / G3) TaxID=412133 RepID=A2FMZ3_TRIV3|nr:galactose-binding domain-like family [Trichomonas vaginalis G3]EAX93722.1 hypothetical protein TVAG_354610 [Trichomonas vaginalis G3]KAI5498727.1 galactose-binding domain-like family [Trichomonas vaginalis G3]|eukprot:XP_001306652.1 hypothetical protein [Trichomonas vaginalis G3]
MLLNILVLEIIPFDDKRENILLKARKEGTLVVDASGSIGQYYSSKCNPTYPNMTIRDKDDGFDWCSSVAKDNNHKPWLGFSVKNNKISVTGYSVRAGCCYYGCCCLDDNTFVRGCCCELYSWSLRGSNDNITWVTIHKVEKDSKMRYCTNRSYDFKPSKFFKYVRLFQDEVPSYCDFCMVVNRFELYGKTETGNAVIFDDETELESDEEISIIGKVKN